MLGFGSKAAIRTMSPNEVRDLIAGEKITLVDVREEGEWTQAHIPGAIHRPLSRLRELAPSLPAGKPIVFYCLGGNRSAQAVALCQGLGLGHDTHMAGGISTWKAHGFPVTR